MDISSTIKKYRDESYIKQVQHAKTASDFRRISNIMSIANIGLVSASGVATNITKDIGTYSFIISLAIYSSLFLTAVQKYLNYDELSFKHESSSTSYSVLYKNILDNIKKPPYLLISTFHILESTSPNIPEYVSKINIDLPEESIKKSTESNNSSSDNIMERLNNL